MSKKIFLIIVAVLLTIIVGSLVYLFIFAPEEEPVPPPYPEPGPTDTAPLFVPPPPASPLTPPAAKVSQVIENRIMGFALKAGEIVYYDQEGGTFYSLPQIGGTPQALIQTKFTNVTTVVWAPDKTAAIMGFSNGSYYHFDLGSGQSTRLMPNIQKIGWFPDGSKIVYIWEKSEEEPQLIVSKPNGDDWEKIKDLGFAKVILLASPERGGPVAMLQNYSYGVGRNIYPVYRDGSAGVVNQIEGYGDHAKWSRDGQRILFEATEAESFETYLWTVDVTGTNQYNLGVKGFVDKCVWNKTNDKIFCAVPSEALGADSVIEDESTDNFWEINTKTGEKRKLFDESESDTKFDALNLWLNLDEDKLYFTSSDDLVYVLQLL